MVRIIPWNLPPVKGGAVGGYTPAPTPVVTNYPYDLDNMSLSADFVEKTLRSGSYRYLLIAGKISVSGVTILDSTSVASVIATVHATPGTEVWDNASSSYKLVEADIDVEIGQIMTQTGGDASITNTQTGGVTYLNDFYAIQTNTYPSLTSTTSTLAVTKITVYNANGVAIQEWTP